MESQRQVIDVAGLPDPSGHSYSHAVRAGDLVMLAGQCGVGADGAIVPGGFEAQAARVLERLEICVQAAGGTRADIVAMTVFVTDIRYGYEFTQVRARFFGSDFPVSALIGVSALMPPGALVEAQATAYLPERR